MVAIERTSPFSYGCYKVVGSIGDDSGLCTGCGSDDLMRHLNGVGVEYGSEWVIEHLIDEELKSINQDDIYDDMLDDCYEAIKIAPLNIQYHTCLSVLIKLPMILANTNILIARLKMAFI